jgi:hypothetical protein
LPEILFGLSVAYSLSGYVLWVVRFFQPKRASVDPPNPDPS